MKTIAIVMLIAGFVFLTGCKKNVVSPNCTEKGKLVTVCGSYLLTSQFITTENGALLYVCRSSAAFPWNTAYDGMPVNFSYEPVTDKSYRKPEFGCINAEIPEYIPVKITCISAGEK
jgi:hypothetical protein